MASRCISTLNDLDKISNRIYHKHSKERLRAGVEAKLKASREKADRSLREIYEGSSSRSKESVSNRSSVGTLSATLSSRRFSTSAASTMSRSRTTECHNIKRGKEKTQCKPSTSKSTNDGQRDRIQRRKTKSCPSCSTDTNLDKNKDHQFDEGKVQHTMSVFGKYNGKGSEYKPTAWFNLPQETSVGVIDSFACDVMNKKPVCYSIDAKKGESVPNLLWHNTEFRVGQNGIVRTEKKRDMVKSEDYDGDVKLGKKRTAPLSWEEQLQWHNACVISTEAHSDGNASPENLCETHPVIFHAKKQTEQEKCSKLDEKKNRSPAYKVALESRWVYPDRRNLVSSYGKCIMSMEVEGTRSSDEEPCSERKCQTQDGVANPIGNEMTQDLKVVKRIPKKVSFEDEGIVPGKTDINKTGEHLNDTSVNETLEEVTATPTKTGDTRKGNFQLDIARKVRPRTSDEGSRKEDQETTKDVRKLRRPHTAPAAPPSSPRIYFDSRHNNCVPIKIPTSQGEMENSNFLLENQTNEESEAIIELSQSSSSEDESGSDIKDEDFPTFPMQMSLGSPNKGAIQDDGALPKKRVTFSKSAPIGRTVSRPEETKILWARSSSAVQRSWNRPPPPNVVEAESPLEMPKNFPPAQALMALRKKIRDDLAQQNHELQLDIQQLYLRKHLE